MARPLRIEFPGAFYHVTARGNERKLIYRDEVDRRRFLERLAQAVDRYRLSVLAYVMMRNHYHLLVETAEANLSRACRQLNGVYTQDFNRRHRRVGHLLQGRYKAIVIDGDSYLLELSRYIHLNPVRVGEVELPWKFAWSSAAAYVGRAAAPPWLTTETVLSELGQRRSEAQRRYERFLLEGIQLGRKLNPWKDLKGQILLGDREWVKEMRTRIDASFRGRDALEVPPLRQLRQRPTVEEVVSCVATRLRSHPEALREKRSRAPSGWPRAVAMYAAWELSDLTQREIGARFGVGPFAVSKAIARVRTELRGNRRKAAEIRQVITSFQT